MTDAAETFQIPLEVAETYEASFVPALFAEWAPVLVEFANVSAGQSVLDVACGTGIVSRTVADRIGETERLVGMDLNDAMLTVARRVRPDIEWQQGDVAAIPFPDASFDVVLCQMAMMFFPDRVRALREMGRVSTSGGTVAVLVPSSLDAQPVWGPFVDIAAKHAGGDARSLLETYWSCGDLEALKSVFETAGLEVTATRSRVGTARFGSVDALVETEVNSTPLVDRLTEPVFARILAETRDALDPFTTSDGALEGPIECHLLAATKR